MMGQPFGGDTGISGHEPTRDMIYMELGTHGVAQNRHAQTRLLQFEKTKKTLVDKAVDMEANLFEQAQSIREAKNVGSEDTYELKLPNKPNEKGYLVKK